MSPTRQVLFVFGTRPEAIKLAPVIKELEKHPEFKAKICVTAQHRQMLDQMLSLFKIKPDYDLDIMRGNQSLFDVTVRVLSEIKTVIRTEKPDIVLVQGDTTTAFIGALATFYQKIPVGHVEAGLRTYKKYSPFPEEMNRVLADHLADFCFAPTERAKRNLLGGGISKEKIFVTGNTVIDALFLVLRQEFRSKGRLALSEFGLPTNDSRLILVTGHQRESFGEGFESICNALKKIAEHNKDIQIIYPVHLNPNVREPVYRNLGETENIHLVEPLEYDRFVFLMNQAYMILTDSGGIQEEAAALGKPVLVMRDATERPEGVKAGIAKLVGTKTGTIVEAAQRLLDDKDEYERMAKATNPYGDGKAAQRIVKILVQLQVRGLING